MVFFFQSATKREIFREVLKHSSMGVAAPHLRSAWKRFFASSSPNGHGSALPYVLGSGCEPLPVGEEGARIHSQGESRSAAGSSSSAARDILQAGGEVDGHRVEGDLQGRSEGQTTPGRSYSILQHQAQGRVDGDDQGSSDRASTGAEGEQGRADVDASSALAWTNGNGFRDALTGISNSGGSITSTSRATCGTQVQECEERIQEDRKPGVGGGEPGCNVFRRSSDLEEGDGSRAEGRGDSEGAARSSHQAGVGEAQGWYPFRCQGSQMKQRSLRKADRAILTDSLKNHAYVERDICSVYEQCHRKEVRERPMGTRKALKVLEIFCGVMTLSIVAGTVGWSVMQPIDKELGRYGIDLSKPSEQKRVLEFIDREQPDLILLAPPCGDYSPLQNIMPKCPMKRWRKTQRLLWKRRRSAPLWKFTRKIMKECISGRLKVRLVGVENPKNSAAWKLYGIPGYPAHIDQCRFGLRLFNGERLVKKPTTIMCSDPEYASLLEARCTCPERFGRRHDHIKGSFRSDDGRWISHSSACGAWTRELCEHFLHCAECVLRPGQRDQPTNPPPCDSFVCGLSGGERETVGLLGRAVNQIYFDVFVEEEEPNENEDDVMTGDEKDGDDDSRKRREIKRLVDRLHVKYGHPSNPVLARTLRLGGAIPEVVDAAKRVSCPVCDRNQPPKQPPRTTVKRAQEFNEILGLDVFFIRDKADYQHLILSMVDQASTYHVMKVIPDKNSETVAAGMMELWVGVFGAPETLQVDQGKEFVGDFAVASECLGSTLKVIPIDSPWKNGVTERHGGIAKQILYKLVDQMSVTDEFVFQMCVAAAAQAKNSLSRVCGYSPVQWVLGKEPSTAFSVLDSPHQLACHDRLLRGGKFAIQSQIREAARVAWIQLDNSDRFRRAILRNPTLQRQSFFPGEQVFIFQYGEWRGPCVVVAEQPHRILWVSFRKALLKVSLEHVRAATSEEILGKQMVDEELDDQFIHLERNGQSRGYVDLTEQGPLVPPGRCRVLGKRPPPPDWVEPEPNVPPALRPTEDFHEQGGGGNLENFDGVAPTAPDSTGEFFQADLPVPENHDSQVSPQYEPTTPGDFDISEELDVPPGDGSGEGPVAGGAEAEMEISDEDFGDVVESSVLPPSGSRDSQVERYEEISGVHDNEEYGPVRHWRDRVRDRQTERVDTSAQHVRNETRLGKHFRKRKTKYPDPKDVFFSELGFLHDLENHQFQGDHFEKTGCTASFQSKFCKCCERVHEVMTVETDETKRDSVVEKGTVWQKGDGCCVAVHQESRHLLLVPSELEGCPVSIGSLKGERLTEVTYEDGTMEILEDDWRRVGSRKLRKPWKGRTIFCLVGDNSQNKGKEYQWSRLDQGHQSLFRSAMDKEWQSFLDLRAVKVLDLEESSKVSKDRILPTRFVLTNKDPTGETLVAKARLVCGGHRDPDIALLRTDSPTTDALGVQLILVIAASFRWSLQAGDVSTAFLSGVFDSRNLYMRPPREGLPGVSPSSLLELKKGVYGLCNAPRLWWRKLRQVLLALGFVELKLLPCVFVMWNFDEHANPVSLQGILAVHVDDVILTGDDLFEKVLVKLKQQLTFGKWYHREFEYTGRTIRQAENGDIFISQMNYSQKVPYVPVTSEQLKDLSISVSEKTVADLRKTAGAACWLSKSSRPDLSFEVSLVQQSINQATFETVKVANQLVRRARQIQYEIKIPCVDLSKPAILVVSDASPGKMPRSGSQGGFFIFVTNQSVDQNSTPVGVVQWLSHRLKRVARSSLATEGMALCEAVEHGEYVRACLAEILDPQFDFRKWEEAASWIEMITGTDCKSVYDNVSSERGISKDRMLALDLAQLKETFESQWKEDSSRHRNAKLRWLPGPRNVADGLTKYVPVQDVMISVLRDGLYCVADDMRLLSRVAETKQAIKVGVLKNAQ